eukprot:COSAG02_NODE_59138_length_275_cov_0.590909_1_plen_67_part_10
MTSEALLQHEGGDGALPSQVHPGAGSDADASSLLIAHLRAELQQKDQIISTLQQKEVGWESQHQAAQ